MDAATAAAVDHLLALSQRDATRVNVPDIVWVYGNDEWKERVALLLSSRASHAKTKRCNDNVFMQRGHSVYNCVHVPPDPDIAAINGILTQLAAEPIRRAILQMVRELQLHVQSLGVTWTKEAKLVIKGSYGTKILFAPPGSPTTGSFPLRCTNIIKAAVEKNFGSGDVDLDLLVNPDLPRARFLEVRRVLKRCAAVCVANLKRHLDNTGLALEVARRTLASEALRAAHVTPEVRNSFIVNWVFGGEHEHAQHPPPMAGIAAIRVIMEVCSFPGLRARPIRLKRSPVYVSCNEQHFMNGSREVRFTLFRCMLAFRANAKLAHAEVLDVSVPHLERSELRTLWEQPMVSVPVNKNEARFYPGPHVHVLAPETQLAVILRTIGENVQPDKQQKRRHRAALISAILDILTTGREEKGREMYSQGHIYWRSKSWYSRHRDSLLAKVQDLGQHHGRY